MKLLIITQKVNKTDPILGFFHRWISEFATQCDQLTVICLEEGNHNLPKNVKVLSLGKENGVSKIKYLINFYKYIWKERRNYNKVFVHMNQIYVIIGALPWKLLRKKVSLWYTHKQVSITLRIAEKLVNTIFTGSEKSFRLPSNKVIVTGHGIDVSLFKKTNNNSQDKKTIISIARISPAKRQLELVKIIKKIKEKIPTIKLILVGPALDKAYLEKIKDYIKQNNLDKNIEIRGPVPNIQIPDLYQDAELLVNISQTGSLDKEVLEAMSAEVPVITSNNAFANIVPKESYATSLDEVYKKITQHFENTPLPTAREKIVKDHNLKNLVNKIVKNLK